jgi:ABC-type uncharacterized transport system permease subunit
MSTLTAFLEATVRTSTPLMLAASSELLVERAGMINIGLEGIILAGAFGGLVGATHGGVAGAIVASMAAGTIVAMLFAVFAVYGRGDQIVTGAAVTLFAVGATGALYRALYGTTGAALDIPTMAPLPIPVLSTVPIIGTALFAQPPITYVAIAVPVFLWWMLYRRHEGLALRATGESPVGATAAGIDVTRTRAVAVLVQGVLGGLAGGTLVFAQSGTFAEGMSAGRGFVAIAIVVLGRWHPIGVGVAAVVFGGAAALQYLLQAIGVAIPYHALRALPYLLTLTALAGVAGRVRAPASLGAPT